MAQNVFAPLIRPAASVLDYMGQMEDMDRAAVQRQAMQAQLAETQRKIQQADQERNALSDLLRQSGGDQNRFISLLEQSGVPSFYQRAQEQRKSMLDARKTEAGIAETVAKTGKAESETMDAALKRYRGMLDQVTTPQQAAQWMQAQYADPQVSAIVSKMGPLETAISSIPQDPQGFDQWRQRSAMGMERFIQNQTQIRGQDMSAETTRRGQDMTDARTRSEGAANRAVQMRGQNMSDARARQAIEQETSTSAPPPLGVPRPAVLPWANQSNAKDANKVKASEVTRGAKEVEKDDEAARADAAAAALAKRFMELNAARSTGGITDKFGIGRGVQSMLSADREEMEAITAKLVPAMRAPGSGATSDYDAKMFERGTIGVDKKREANEAIAAGIIARGQLSQDYAAFRQTYLEQNGTLQGSDRYWRQYVSANPIFDPKSTAPKINQARQGWREFFSGEAPQAPAPAPAPAAGKPSVSNW